MEKSEEKTEHCDRCEQKWEPSFICKKHSGQKWISTDTEYEYEEGSGFGRGEWVDESVCLNCCNCAVAITK